MALQPGHTRWHIVAKPEETGQQQTCQLRINKYAKRQSSNLSRINIASSWYTKRCKCLLVCGIVCLLCASSRVCQKITTWCLMCRSIDIFGTPGHSVQVLVHKCLFDSVVQIAPTFMTHNLHFHAIIYRSNLSFCSDKVGTS
jgi:hypothetical protein